ncbi:hypothetical protein [Deinococcus sp. NW-56]|uniref:hypothetical protein n=1 Tax=Deinococcus sp. NW-56 TaxID=2080419 RepID=UPI000CF38183|nr:hypothetical protein [Deinococcus sp. NW-56]
MPRAESARKCGRGAAVPGRIETLEGGRGFVRLALNLLLPGAVPEGEDGWGPEMHAGPRVRVRVSEWLEGRANGFRVRLLGRG